MPSIDAALRAGTAQLQVAGVAHARLDARLLLSAASGLSHEDMIRDPYTELLKAHAAAYAAMITRRISHEPVARILGRREFWSMDFEITPETLDPRADSETLISAALGLIEDCTSPLRILDIGTGTGCLLLALMSELPRAYGVGMDISQSALDVAARNAARLGFAECAQFIACDVRGADWAAQLAGPFDIVISNPPYIKSDEIAGLDPEVALFDPPRALDGGTDGLDFYRMITISLASLLGPGGMVVFEVGAGKARDVQSLLHQAGFRVYPPYADLARCPRAVIGRYVG